MVVDPGWGAQGRWSGPRSQGPVGRERGSGLPTGKILEHSFDADLDLKSRLVASGNFERALPRSDS